MIRTPEKPLIFGAFVVVWLRLGAFVGLGAGDHITALEPAAQIDLGAAARAEGGEFRVPGFAADRTGVRRGGHRTPLRFRSARVPRRAGLAPRALRLDGRRTSRPPAAGR